MAVSKYKDFQKRQDESEFAKISKSDRKIITDALSFTHSYSSRLEKSIKIIKDESIPENARAGAFEDAKLCLRVLWGVCNLVITEPSIRYAVYAHGIPNDVFEDTIASVRENSESLSRFIINQRSDLFAEKYYTTWERNALRVCATMGRMPRLLATVGDGSTNANTVRYLIAILEKHTQIEKVLGHKPLERDVWEEAGIDEAVQRTAMYITRMVANVGRKKEYNTELYRNLLIEIVFKLDQINLKIQESEQSPEGLMSEVDSIYYAVERAYNLSSEVNNEPGDTIMTRTAKRKINKIISGPINIGHDIISERLSDVVLFLDSLERIQANAERSTALGFLSEESKLDSAELASIFEGELDREAMAAALSAAMKEQGLSVRKTAAAVDTSTNDIQRITKGTATLDKAAEVLSGLGYELHVEVRKPEQS